MAKCVFCARNKSLKICDGQCPYAHDYKCDDCPRYEELSPERKRH